jgi:uncharacterized protein (DUF427 family)
VEGNAYFPKEAVNSDLIEPSQTTTFCPWKGTANYYTLVVGGQKNIDAVWYYAEPYEKAEKVRGRVAFWKGVVIDS